MNRTITIKFPDLEQLCMIISRSCVYLYSLVFFLRTVIAFPPRLDGYLRFGIAAFGILATFASKQINLRQIHLSNYFIWYAGLLIISLFSSLYSVGDNPMSFTNNIFDILFIGTSFSVCIENERDIKKYLFVFSICGGIIFLVLMSKNLLYVDDRLGRSLTGDNTNSFALFLMLTLFAAIGSFYLNKMIVIKIVCTAICLVDIYMLMLSGGRKYILVPIVLIASISLIQTSGTKNVLKRLAMILLIVLGIIAGWRYMLSNPILYNSIGLRFINRVSISNRELYIVKGLEFFLGSPLWGHGENSFATLIVPYHGSQIYSHNNYIELLTNFGLIGFTWYYYYFGKTLKTSFQDAIKTKNPLTVYCSSLMISMLFLDMGIISYCESSLLFTFWVLCFNVAFIILPTRNLEKIDA